MPTSDDTDRSGVAEIDSAISNIKQGDDLVESGEQSLAAGKYREAISQLKRVQQQNEKQVHEIAGKLLRCAYQRGKRLINNEPVPDPRDIENILEETRTHKRSNIEGPETKEDKKRDHPRQSIYRNIRERIAKGDRLQKAGEYDAAIACYEIAKDVVDQQLTDLSGKSLKTEIDLQLRKTRDKKQPEGSDKLNRIYKDIRERIADGDRLQKEHEYNDAIESYQKANEIINQRLVGSSGKTLKTEINLNLKKARGKKRQAVKWVKKLDEVIQQLNHERLTRHGFDLPYRRAAIDSDAVSEPPAVVYTPPLTPEAIDRITAYYRELQSFERQLGSVATETGQETAATRLLGDILEARHSDVQIDPEGEQDVVSAAQNVLEGYMILVEENDTGGITDLEDRLKKIRSDTEGKEYRVDTEDLTRRLTDIRSRTGERATAIQQIEKLDIEVQQLDHDLLSRHGFDLPYHRAAAESQAVNEPAEMVYTPPIDLTIINSVASYYRELQSFERQLKSVNTETGRPTTVTRLLGAILETRHLDVQIDPEGEQDVVGAAQNVLEGYLLLVEKGDDSGITDLEDHLKKIRSDTEGKEYRVDAEDLTRRLTDTRAWTGKRAKRVDLQSRTRDLRSRWPATAGEHLSLDIDVIEQLIGSDSREPSLSQFESGLETAERIVELATDVKAVRTEYGLSVVDRLPKAFGQYLNANNSSNASLDRLEKTLNVVETTLDAHRQHPSYPFDRVVEHICAKMEENTFDEELGELITLIEEASDVIDFLDCVDTAHPSVQPDAWRESIHTGLETVSPESVRPLASLIDRMGETLWERRHLYQYDWDDFEDLVASVFASKGYKTRVTQGTRDGGVDIWARHRGDRVAIEVKQARSNQIGRPPLQKLSSHIPKGDADRVIIVTSSNFGQTAQDYAEEFGPEMRLVDGEELIQMLTESDHPPPLIE